MKLHHLQKTRFDSQHVTRSFLWPMCFFIAWGPSKSDFELCPTLVTLSGRCGFLFPAESHNLRNQELKKCPMNDWMSKGTHICRAFCKIPAPAQSPHLGEPYPWFQVFVSWLSALQELA